MLVILDGLSIPVQLNYKSPPSYNSLKSDLLKNLQIDLNEFSVYLSGKLLISDGSLIQPESGNIAILQVQIKVLGGKGGFGSQLKAIGAQIQKTTSREACRDLSGRRVRDVNAEKAFSEMARQEKRRAEERQEQKLRRREKRWAQRAVPPKLEDPVYYRSLTENDESVSAALRHAQHNNGKRPHESGTTTAVKRPTFLGMDEDISESDPEEERPGITNTDSIPPITTVEPITDTPPPLHTSEQQPVSNQVLSDKEADDIQTQTPEESPINPNSETSNSAEVNTLLINDVTIPPTSDPVATEPELIDLEAISTKEDLEKFGLDSLKQTLISLGLKCGGTLQERVGRLYSYKVTPKEELPDFLFAAKGKRQAKKPDKR